MCVGGSRSLIRGVFGSFFSMTANGLFICIPLHTVLTHFKLRSLKVILPAVRYSIPMSNPTLIGAVSAALPTWGSVDDQFDGAWSWSFIARLCR